MICPPVSSNHKLFYVSKSIKLSLGPWWTIALWNELFLNICQTSSSYEHPWLYYGGGSVVEIIQNKEMTGNEWTHCLQSESFLFLPHLVFCFPDCTKEVGEMVWNYGQQPSNNNATVVDNVWLPNNNLQLLVLW